MMMFLCKLLSCLVELIDCFFLSGSSFGSEILGGVS